MKKNDIEKQLIENNNLIRRRQWEGW